MISSSTRSVLQKKTCFYCIKAQYCLKIIQHLYDLLVPTQDVSHSTCGTDTGTQRNAVQHASSQHPQLTGTHTKKQQNFSLFKIINLNIPIFNVIITSSTTSRTQLVQECRRSRIIKYKFQFFVMILGFILKFFDENEIVL